MIKYIISCNELATVYCVHFKFGDLIDRRAGTTRGSTAAVSESPFSKNSREFLTKKYRIQLGIYRPRSPTDVR